MRLRLAPASLLALASAAVACDGGGSARLQGTWKGVRAEGVALNANLAANAFATGMTIEVKGDGITVVTPSHDRQTGRYKVVRDDKTAVVITTDRDGPADPQTFTFVDDRTMKWAVLDGQSIVFSRP